LLISLTLPEICTALTVDNSVFIREKHYAQFVDKYASGFNLGLTGIECYRLRGGVVHRANMAGHPFIGVSHVIFTLPETGGSVHALSMEVKDSIPPKRAAMLDLVMFCGAMVGAVRIWY
jgi:hypothetical protein